MNKNNTNPDETQSSYYQIQSDSDIEKSGYEKLENEVFQKVVINKKPDLPLIKITENQKDQKLKISLSHEQLSSHLKIPSANNVKPSRSETGLERNPIEIVIKPPISTTNTVRKSIKVDSSPNRKDEIELNDDHRFKCDICNEFLMDPRVLDCLHSFCFTCLINHFGNDSDVLFPDKSSQSGASLQSEMTNPPIPVPIRKGSSRSNSGDISIPRPKSRNSLFLAVHRPIPCPTCGTVTELPVGGIPRLPKNTLLERLIEKELQKSNHDSKHVVICNICNLSVPAKGFCNDCRLNLCNFCLDGHLRHKATSNHEIKTINATKNYPRRLSKDSKKCLIHPNTTIKLFCTSCNQVACSDCIIVIHRGHKCEPIQKALKMYSKMLTDHITRVRPLSEYATVTISKLTGVSKKIEVKCGLVKNEVDLYLKEYQDAVEVHRKTLLNQIEKAKVMKLESINSQKLDLELRSSEAQTAIDFAEDLMDNGSDIEIMSFVGILMKRFDYCQKSKVPLDAKVSESMRFIPEVRAPSTSAQNNIPLYGIITTQTACPKFCILEDKGLLSLKVNKRVDLTLFSRDSNEKQLCHGGLNVNVDLKYKDLSGRPIPTQISDKRDGSYVIAFIPDAPGIMKMNIAISGKPIKNSPFTLLAKNLKPHTGIFHCCTFCSSNASKLASCACEGTMEGYKGCGHGHSGHPGRRHWSCCASVLENSECATANNLVYN